MEAISVQAKRRSKGGRKKRKPINEAIDFHGFVGNIKAKDKLSLLIHEAIDSPQARMPHMAFLGPPGVGKTTMAEIVASETGRKYHYISSTAVKNPLVFHALINDIENRQRGAIIMMDECHRLKPVVQDSLLSATDHSRRMVTIWKEEIIEDIVPINISFVFATTHRSFIRAALLSRLEEVLFDNYNLEEKTAIATNYLVDKRIEAERVAIRDIAVRSRNARDLTKHCDNLIRYIKMNSLERITRKVTQDAFDALDIDVNGLTTNDIRYLAVLKLRGQVGLDTLASFCQMPKGDITNNIEPWLLQNQLIMVLKGGRVITRRGIDALERKQVVDSSDIDKWLDD